MYQMPWPRIGRQLKDCLQHSSYFISSLYQVCSEKRRPRKRMEKKKWSIFSFNRIKFFLKSTRSRSHRNIKYCLKIISWCYFKTYKWIMNWSLKHTGVLISPSSLVGNKVQTEWGDVSLPQILFYSSACFPEEVLSISI